MKPSLLRLLLSLSAATAPSVRDLAAAVPAAPPVPPAGEVITLSAFEVVEREDAGYTASNVVSATRIREAIKDTPLNISVLTEELLLDLKASTLMDALQFTSGVNFEDERNGSFQVRGYRVWIPRRNGSRTNHPYVQTANVDRVEFIRGPASVLYGEADPGGIINTLTKRPKPQSRTTLALTAGSWEFYRADLDWNQPLNRSKTVLARVNLSLRKSDSWVDFARDDAQLISGAVQWKPTRQTIVVFDYEWVVAKRRLPGLMPRFSDPAATSSYADETVRFWDRTVQRYVERRLGDSYPRGRFFSYRFVDVPRSFSFNGPASRADGDAQVGMLEISHQFSRDLQARLSFYVADRDDDDYRFGSATFRNENGFFAANNVNPAQAYVQNGRSIGIMGQTHNRGHSVQADVYWSRRFGGVENKLILSADQAINRQTTRSYNAGRLPVAERLPAPVNLVLRPGVPVVYNDPPWSPEKFTLASDSKGETRAFSVSDQVVLFDQRWRLLAGARYQRTGTTQVQSLWTPQYGTTFHLTPSLTLYGLYSESFTQQFQRRPEDNDWADPVLGKGREVGLKLELWERRVSGMVALFQTDRFNQFGTIPLDPPNPAQYNPNSQTVYRDEGSEGLEIDLMLVPSRNWQITAGYAYTDSEVTANPGERNTAAQDWPSVVGAPLANTPRHRFNTWGRYNVSSGALKGLYLGAGAIYAGRRVAQVDGRTLFFYLPSSTRVDLLAGYRHKAGRYDLDYSVRVENAFDEYCLRSQNAFGPPRNFKFTVRTSF